MGGQRREHDASLTISTEDAFGISWGSVGKTTLLIYYKEQERRIYKTYTSTDRQRRFIEHVHVDHYTGRRAHQCRGLQSRMSLNDDVDPVNVATYTTGRFSGDGVTSNSDDVKLTASDRVGWRNLVTQCSTGNRTSAPN